MDQSLLHSLEGLLTGAIPTMVLFVFLFFVYRALVHNPLRKALGERRQRTQGALARAQADIAAAEAKTADYEQRARAAKLAIFKSHEAARQGLAEMREAGLAEARNRAQALVREARAALEQDVARIRLRLQQESEGLAVEIIRAVLKPVGAAPAESLS